MNSIDIENKLNELKNCEYITIHYYLWADIYEIFLYKDIINSPNNNCLKCLMDDRTFNYSIIKSIQQSI